MQGARYLRIDDPGLFRTALDEKALSNLQTSALPLGYRALVKGQTSTAYIGSVSVPPGEQKRDCVSITGFPA